MAKIGTSHGTIAGSGRVSSLVSGGSRGHGTVTDAEAVVSPLVFADTVTRPVYSAADIRSAFRDTIRGSIYELYEKRGLGLDSD